MAKRHSNTHSDTKRGTRKYLVLVTAIYPVEMPADVAAKEADEGTLDHEIWERFERTHVSKIGLDAIRDTVFYNADGSTGWKPVYRLPQSALRNEPLNAQEKRRATKAYFTGDADDVFEPVPPGRLPI